MISQVDEGVIVRRFDEDDGEFMKFCFNATFQISYNLRNLLLLFIIVSGNKKIETVIKKSLI